MVLVAWLLLLVFGFGLVICPLLGGTFTDGLRQAGSSVFTLGIAASPEAAPTVADCAAAATGLLVLTLELAYMPSLYAAYNRRETLVILLQHRTGGVFTGEQVLA